MIQRSTSLLDYLDKRLGSHSGRGPEFQFPCPVCIERTGSETHKRKFSINLDKRAGQCFRCEYKFRDIAALFRCLNRGRLTVEERILLREDPPIIVGSISRTVRGILHSSTDRFPVPLRREELPREYVRLGRRTREHPAFLRAHRYLASREVPYRTVREFRVGFCTSGEYRGYLIFPVMQSGEVVYWTNRAVSKSARLKTKNPPKRPGYFSRDDCLLNYDNVVGQRVVALVEGPFDCMAPAHALGLMGRVMSPAQEKLIAKLVKRGLRELVLLLDPGTGSDIDKIRSRLMDVVPVVTVLNLGSGDPASRRQDLQRLMRRRREPTILDRARLRLSTK